MTLERDGVERIVRTLRGYAAAGHDIGIVVCGKRGAYVERSDPHFRDASAEYYAHLDMVDDVLAPDDEILKIAVADFSGPAGVLAALEPFAQSHRVVVSGQHWIDVMSPEANKGVAVRALQAALGATPAQTVAFGDYLNDVQMLGAADHSFAMADAHPGLIPHARRRIGSNADHAVLGVLDEILGR